MKYLYTVDELLAMAARPANGFGCDECGRLWLTSRPGLSVPVTPTSGDCRHPKLRPAYVTEEPQP
jgi:hypothetical protein